MAKNTIDEAIEHLRKKHIRITPQRRLVLEYLIQKETIRLWKPFFTH